VTTSSSDGWAASTRRERIPGIAVSTDVIVGFCGETRAQFEATLRLLQSVRYEQVFAAAYSARPGTPARHLADDVPAGEKRARLNELLALQEEIGLALNRDWLGRTAEVLVERIVPPRRHQHASGPGSRVGEGSGAAEMAGVVELSGRTRGHKLVHLLGTPDLIGQLVRVAIEHAGPYSLQGTVLAS
jgi:tRNA-2-methylthio-N6-dimethylallyladenosine synthase